MYIEIWCRYVKDSMVLLDIDIKRRDILVEVVGDSVCGDKYNDLRVSIYDRFIGLFDGLKFGDTMLLGVSISSREWNGRHFTDVRAKRLLELNGVDMISKSISSNNNKVK